MRVFQTLLDMVNIHPNSMLCHLINDLILVESNNKSYLKKLIEKKRQRNFFKIRVKNRNKNTDKEIS